MKHWVRNVERDERFSFWFPTSTDYFYPDFVAELDDGRLILDCDDDYLAAQMLKNSKLAEALEHILPYFESLDCD